MNVLGVHIGHDSSAALVSDGKIIADLAEERFTRVKHYSGTPLNAIQECLNIARFSMDDIDVIAMPTLSGNEKINYFFELNSNNGIKDKIRKRLKKVIFFMLTKGKEKPPIYIKKFPSKIKEIYHVNHHLAHAASAYYTCGSMDDQLIVTMDGVGENNTSITISVGQKGKISVLKRFDKSGSLGWFYGNVTEALGWHHGDGEGKTMGLAPYGNYHKTKGVLDKFYPKYSNGNLIEPHDFGISYYWNEDGAFQWHFDEAIEIHRLIDKYGKENIAAEAQRVLEEEACAIIYPWMEKENIQNLCCSGGVFLNVKLNQRIWQQGKIKEHHIFPNAGDSGLAVGAALYSYHQLTQDTQMPSIEDLYWGNEFTNNEIKQILDARQLVYSYEEDIVNTVAKFLADGKIIGWFEGRMESGPRALGSRSILMSPLKAENKDIINSRVKFREAFRPFCPSILAEKADDYLVNFRTEKFMITSFDVHPNKKSTIPAVVHVDGTLRPQMVYRNVNARYWDLINAFGGLTGEYVLLNTSFNIKGEPIICNPRQAIRCFYDTGLDYLVLGNYLLKK